MLLIIIPLRLLVDLTSDAFESLLMPAHQDDFLRAVASTLLRYGTANAPRRACYYDSFSLDLGSAGSIGGVLKGAFRG